MKITPRVKEIIEKNTIALATIDEGKPYVIAVAFCRVVSDDEILITDNYMEKTLKNIKENNNVALVVWKGFKGYQILGTCEYIQKGKWAEYVKNLKENKKMPAKGAILVKVNKIIKSK